MKRLNKEYNLDNVGPIRMKVGTINKDDPKVVYVSGKCWVSPSVETDYKKSVLRVESLMKRNIRKYLINENNFDNKLILDFDLSSDGLRLNDKRFMSFDFYLRQNSENIKKLKELKETLRSGLLNVSSQLVYDFNENGFHVSDTK